MPTMRDGVPVIDFARPDPATISAVGDAVGRFGFVSLVGHGVDTGLIDKAYSAAAELFALPSSVLDRYERASDAHQRGYCPFRREKAVAGVAPDLKAFWHVGREIDDDHPLVRRGLMLQNEWPTEAPRFAPAMKALFTALEDVALRLLDALSIYLGTDPRFMREMVRDGNSVLRVIHYPEVVDAEPGAVRAAAHEDINLLTVLPAATRPGLQLLSRDGEWLPITCPPNALVCDTGDMMQVLTGGQLPATTHRVVNPDRADGGRLSMPFFLHPHPDAELSLPGAPPTGINAHELLMARLAQNGVA